MAFAGQNNISDLDIGTYLKIYSSKGVYNNLSDQSEMWKMMLKRKSKDPEGREHRFNLRSALGMASAQFLAVSDGDYPEAQRSDLNEGLAKFKDFGLSVNVPRTLLNKGTSALAAYGAPLAEELDSKTLAIAKMLSASIYGDGSGAIGRINGTPVLSTSTDDMIITLDNNEAEAGRSHIGWFEMGDRIKFATSAGVADTTTNNAGTTVSYWKVTDIDEDAGTVTLQPYSSAHAAIAVTSTTIGSTDPDNDSYAYRIGTTPQDLTAISTNDYNSLSEVWPGLESLTADDGRKVHGLTMSGSIKGSRKDVEAAVIDSSHFQQIMSKVKRNVGKNRYKYENALMNDSAYDAIVESGETDRRFQVRDSLTRGVKSLGYQHQNDFIDFVSDVYCPSNRIFIPPTSKEVLHFIGKEFSFVEPNPGQKFSLKNSSTGAGHKRAMQAYMEGSGIMVCQHPAAIGVLTNFTV